MQVKNRKDPGFIQEDKNLQALEGKISASLREIKQKKDTFQKDLLKTDDADIKKDLFNKINQYEIYSQQYKESIPSPYYARVGFLVNGKEESYVIGKTGLSDFRKQSDILVLDWRSDLAQTYTQKTQNSFTFGGVPYQLILRRGVTIKNSRLISYNDQYVNKTGKAAIVPTKPEDIIVDPFLLELLEDQRRINAVTDIIASIQENQNRIITQPYDKNFIVQGCSGSGKTMILLHRLSYLLFNKLQENLPLNNIRMITPNKDFNYFIRDLMRQLDLSNVPAIPIEELYSDLITRVTSALEAEKPYLPDDELPKGSAKKYYSAEFLQQISDAYEAYWKRMTRSLREYGFNTDFENVFNAQKTLTYAVYQTLFEIHRRNSGIVEKVIRDLTNAQEKVKIAPKAVRIRILDRLDKIPHEAELISKQKAAALAERQEYVKKLNENLSEQKKMEAYLDYETYRTDTGSILKIRVEKHIPDIIRQIKNYEREIESLPDYDFVQRLEMQAHLKKLKEEYKRQASALFKESLQQIDTWKREIERCDKVISESDRKQSVLAETEKSLRMLQNRITGDAAFDHFSDAGDHPEWAEILAPYTEAKEALAQAERRRDNNAEYQQYRKIGGILELMKPESVYKAVYEESYLPDIERHRSDKNQYHFELFLKLHFCQRYFGRINSRMFINIDEGQTIYPAEYQALRGILPENSIFNIYGDINQKTDIRIGLRNWAEISKFWEIFQLKENYRNTKQITAFCNHQFYAGLIPIGIEGPEVESYELGTAVNKFMTKYLKEPKERYAIIWDGSKENRNLLLEQLRGYKNVLWKYSAEPGVYVLSADSARGLEFENVLVFDKDMSFGAKYIAYTRSLNRLIIVDEVIPAKIEESEGMMTRDEFVRRVSVQSETVDQYIQDGKLIPDLVIPGESSRKKLYFSEGTLLDAAEKFGWKLIDDSNRREIFLQMVQDMNMSASYKPVLLKAFFETASENGAARISDIVAYFHLYYEDRKSKGLVVEKEGSIFSKDSYTDQEIKNLILKMPLKRFEDMGMMRLDPSTGMVKMEGSVWQKLTGAERMNILRICDVALERYYRRFEQ